MLRSQSLSSSDVSSAGCSYPPCQLHVGCVGLDVTVPHVASPEERTPSCTRGSWNGCGRFPRGPQSELGTAQKLFVEKIENWEIFSDLQIRKSEKTLTLLIASVKVIIIGRSDIVSDTGSFSEMCPLDM